MKVVIASDHGGYEMKKQVIAHLTDKGYVVIDKGTDSDASCDYPIYADKACKAITSGEAELGILICGTGIGMSMAANKHKGIRAALCHDTFSAEATRSHNNANIVCLGARVIGPGLAIKVIDTFLETPFSNDERHIRRISMYD